jgi:hypothetical protein
MTGAGGANGGDGPRTTSRQVSAVGRDAAASAARRRRLVLVATGATVVVASAVIVYSIRQESGEARDPGYDRSAPAESAPAILEPPLPLDEPKANAAPGSSPARNAPSDNPASAASAPTLADSRDAGTTAPLAAIPDPSSPQSSPSSSSPPSHPDHPATRAAHASRDAGAPSRSDAAVTPPSTGALAAASSSSSAPAAQPTDAGAPLRRDAGRPLPGRIIGGASSDPNGTVASNEPAPRPGQPRPDSSAASRRLSALERSRSEEEGALRQVDRFVPTGGITLSGRVIDADVGKPIAGTLVHVHHEGTLVEGVTDGQGAFRLPGMVAGSHVVLWIGRAGDPYIDERLELAVPAGGDTVDAGTVKLLRGDELSSRVDGWVGLFVTRRSSQIIVSGVSPWTPADQEGLEVGDQIVSIDGRDVTGLGPRAVTFMLRGRVGGSVALVVRAHGGQKRKVALARVVR